MISRNLVSALRLSAKGWNFPFSKRNKCADAPSRKVFSAR